MNIYLRCLVLFVFATLALAPACGGEQVDPGETTSAEKSEPNAAPGTAPPQSSEPDSPSGAQATEAQSGEEVPRAQAQHAGPSLAGEWVLESMGDAADPQASVEGVTVTAQFTGSMVTGNAGCNGYSAAYEVGSGQIKVTQPVATRKFCSATGVMEQEAAYLAALAEASTYSVEDERLTIAYGAERRLTFRREG